MVQVLHSSGVTVNSGLNTEVPQVTNNYRGVNSFFEKGRQKFNEGLDYIKNHKLATISALAAGAVAFIIYTERDKSAPTFFSSLAEPLEHAFGRCFTEICANTENLALALESKSIEDVLSIKGPFRGSPRGENEMLWFNFNKQVGQFFFAGENIKGNSYLSVFNFLRHPMFHEVYGVSWQPVGDLAMKEYDYLHESGQQDKIPAFAKELKTILAQLKAKNPYEYPFIESMRHGSSFLAFLEFLEEETGVPFFEFFYEAKPNTSTHDDSGYKNDLGLFSNATQKEVKSKCRHLLAAFHPDKKSSNSQQYQKDQWSKISLACEELRWRR